MFKGEYVEVGAIVALILAGALCLLWGNAPTESYTELSEPAQVDASR